MREGYTAAELAAMHLPGLSSAPNKVRARARREAWPSIERPARGGRGVERVHPVDTLPPALREAIAQRLASATSAPALVEAPSTYAAIAQERYRVVAAVVELVGRGELVAAAIESVRGEHSARTVRRWYDAVRKAPRTEWLRILLPSWKGTRRPDECHPDAWAFFRDWYLRGSRPSFAESFAELVRVAKHEGWEPIPSLNSLIRRYRREVAPTTEIVKRHGPDALEREYPALQRDKSDMAANDAWNADGHVFDLRVRWPDGTIERPTVVAFQDVAFGAILGWRVDRSENADLVRLSFADAVTGAFTGHKGAPRHVYFDNGLAFASKGITGGCHWRFRGRVRPEDPVGVITQLVEEVHWVRPRHGQSKPLERAWRDITSIARHAAFEGAYLGSNPTKRPHDYKADHAIDLDVFLAVATAYFKDHNERAGRRSATARGRSLLAAYDESYRQIVPRVLTADQERLLWLAAEGVRVRSTGAKEIVLAGNHYWCEALIPLAGQDVVARFDPDTLHAGIHVYRRDGTYVGHATCFEARGFADRQAARDHGRARSAFTKAAKELARLETRHDAGDLATMSFKAMGVPQTARGSGTSVVQPIFGAPKLTKAAEVTAREQAARREREEADLDETASLFAGEFASLFVAANDD